MRSLCPLISIAIVAILSTATVASSQQASQQPRPAKAGPLDGDFDFKPAQRNVGERLFLDTRFAKFFYLHNTGNVNRELAEGDPALDEVQVPNGKIAGPFKGKSFNCRACHYVDELAGEGGAANRTYTDYASRSPMPANSRMRTTARNSIAFVNAFIAEQNGSLFHADGEFASLRTLIERTLTGPNLGWGPQEHDEAVAHIVRVIREDDGTAELARQYGGSYRQVLLGVAPSLRAGLKLPLRYRLDIDKATDRQIMDHVVTILEAYLRGLEFSRGYDGYYDGSPYDVFLRMNGLPLGPAPNESDLSYSKRLARALDELESPRFVEPGRFVFAHHDQPFVFGPKELQGLKIFLRQSEDEQLAPSTAAVQPGNGQGNIRHQLAIWSGLVLLAGICFLFTRSQSRAIGAVAAVFCVFAFLLAGSRTGASSPQDDSEAVTHTGNCVSCHPTPNFTDSKFHNTGATQDEYDAIYGSGAFAALRVPTLKERTLKPNLYLPATSRHPNAQEPFRAAPTKADRRLADMGVWNIFANPDYPEPQPKLRALFCPPAQTCDEASALPRTIAVFKTPTLRDLADSQPYLHNGTKQTTREVLAFYRSASRLARAHRLRNGDPEISNISIDNEDAEALNAFLASLTEDYEAPIPVWKR